MESLRSFVALRLSQEIHNQLAWVQDELKKSAADVKWVKPCAIHLTLKFLDNVSLKLLEEVKNVINRLAGEHQGFKLTINRLGAFPKIEHPRVIWVGIGQGSDESIRLAQGLEKSLAGLGFLPEKRPFKPHLTLGRVRSSHNRDQLKKLLASLNILPKTMHVETLTLFKSTLTPQGAIYQALHEANLS